MVRTKDLYEQDAYQSYIDAFEDDLIERYIDTDPDAPDDLYIGVVDDDYPDVYDNWLSNITIDNVPDEFISEQYELWCETKGGEE